jgi:hypothetical protein
MAYFVRLRLAATDEQAMKQVSKNSFKHVFVTFVACFSACYF